MDSMAPLVTGTATVAEGIMLLIHTRGILLHLPMCDTTIITMTRGTEIVIMTSITSGITTMTDMIVITIVEITDIRIAIAETNIIIRDIIVHGETGVET